MWFEGQAGGFLKAHISSRAEGVGNQPNRTRAGGKGQRPWNRHVGNFDKRNCYSRLMPEGGSTDPHKKKGRACLLGEGIERPRHIGCPA